MRSWKANFIALLIAETLAMVGFGLSSPVLPLFLEEDLGITDPVRLKAWVGIISTAASFTLAVFAPIWGHLSDIFNRRVMLLRAMFGGACIITLMTFANSPWQLLVLKTIQGCLTGTVAAATVIVANISPVAQMAFCLGLLTTGISVGNSLGPLLGGIIADFLGYRITFLSTGIVLALGGFIVLKFVDKDNGGVQNIPAAENNEKAKKKFKLFPSFGPIFASPVLFTIMLVSLSINTASSIASPMLPLFLKELALRVSGEALFIGSSTGIVLGVGSATSALAAVLVGKYSMRLGYWRTLLICVTAGAIMTVPQIFVINMQQLTILRAFSSFFIGGTSPVISALIVVTCEKKSQGAIFGINSAMAFIGSALGPLIGTAAAMISYRTSFLVSASIIFLCVFAVLKRREKAK